MRAFNAFLAVATTQLLWTTSMHRTFLAKVLIDEKDPLVMTPKAAHFRMAEETMTHTRSLQIDRTTPPKSALTNLGKHKDKDNHSTHRSHSKHSTNTQSIQSTHNHTKQLQPPPTTEAATEEAPPKNSFNTPSVKCRLGMEQWQNNNIDRWIKNKETPLVEWVWELTNETTGRTYYRGLMNVLWCGGRGTCTQNRTIEIASWEWTWQDYYGRNHKAAPLQITDLKFEPRLYFHLDPSPPTATSAAAADDWKNAPKYLWPTMPNGTTPAVYDLEPYLRCNKIEKANPPPPQAKIGACITRFWGQHDLMPEWIAYHRMIGIEHFFFFVSEPFEHIQQTMPSNESDITYIPYYYTWDNHAHNGHEEMVTTPGGWSEAAGENWFQNMANNQCLYMAKQYGFDWIISPDVDEYIVVHDPFITHFTTPSPLQQYLQKYHPQTTTTTTNQLQPPHASPEDDQQLQHPLQGSQVCLYGGGYGKHPDQFPNNTKWELSIDFTWRKHRQYGNGEGYYNGNGGAQGRKKCFYNPRLVTDVGIHSALGIVGKGYLQNSRETVTAANSTRIELYHFRSPLLGPTALPGPLRGKRKIQPDELESYPQLRNMYKKRVMKELKRLNWSLPKLGKHICQRYRCDKNSTKTNPDGQPVGGSRTGANDTNDDDQPSTTSMERRIRKRRHR